MMDTKHLATYLQQQSYLLL